MAKAEGKHKTVKISIFLSIVLSLSVIILLLYFTLDAETITMLTSATIRYEFFAAAICTNIIFWFLWGARLKVLSNAIDPDIHISFWESTKIVIANLFLAGITPSMAGGEPVRVHLLTRNGLSLGGATASVLGERLLDALFLLICVPFAFYIYKDRVDVQLISYGLTIGIFIFIAGVFLFLYAIYNPNKIKAFLIWIDTKIAKLRKRKKPAERKTIQIKINREVDNLHTSMQFFLTKGRRTFLLGGLITVVFWSTGFMIPSLILLGLGFEPFLIESYAAQVLLIIIVMMPLTPGSAGVTEGGAAALYVVLIGQSFIGVFVLLFRFITYHMNLIGGAIFQYLIFKSVASFSMDTIKKPK